LTRIPSGFQSKHKKPSEWAFDSATLFAQLTHSIGLNDVCDGLRLHSGPLSGAEMRSASGFRTSQNGRGLPSGVMGRSAGWIALFGGIAGCADVILIPEIPFEWNHVADAFCEGMQRVIRAR
jgi:phosphofructokinase